MPCEPRHLLAAAPPSLSAAAHAVHAVLAHRCPAFHPRTCGKTHAVRAVLAHRRPVFHPRTCGLRGGAAATAALIGCWDQEELGSWDVIDYFLYIDARLLPLRCVFSGNDL